MTSDVESLVRAYESQGVIRVPQLYDDRMMQRVRRQVDRYIRELVPTLPKGNVTFEADGTTVRNLWRMDQYDPFFRQLAQDPQLLQLIGRLAHGEPELVGVETFNKRAKVGSAVPPHQDNAYFCRTPADALTVWIAVDAVTLENGPIFYIEGSHRQGLLPHKPSGVAGNSMGLDTPFDSSNPFVGTLDAGDALVHHCQIIHYSAPNRSDHSRCGLLMVFRGAHTREDAALKARYAPQAIAG